MTPFPTLRKYSGIALLILVYLVALARVISLDAPRKSSGRKLLTISHWQMEAGVRDAIDEAASAYEKLHPDVEIKQIIIGERNYSSWITTRLIGGSAPDIIALGGTGLERPLLLQLYQRYFVPLAKEIERPNPYNEGTPLLNTSWKETFYDNMESSFISELSDYYQIPSSAFTVRLFYNKPLFRATTGLDEPPSDFHSFISACGKIASSTDEHGRRLIPIAGAGKYNARILWERFDQTVNTSLLPDVDFNSDCEAGDEESIIAFTGGKVSFSDPRIRAMFKGRELYNAQFQPAFYSADRMDAAFLFLQKRALMIASGSWDAGSYAREATFEIGICDFPLPSRDDPEFGSMVSGHPVEELEGGFSFGINRFGPHPDVALDFVKFLSSQGMNRMINERIGWIPMVRGNTPSKFIAPFWPKLDGVKAGIKLRVGGQNVERFDELANLHAAGRLTFDEFVERYRTTFVKNADLWMRYDWIRNQRQSLAQDDFSKISARQRDGFSGDGSSKALAHFAVQLSRTFNSIEMRNRYEKAREHSPLPKP